MCSLGFRFFRSFLARHFAVVGLVSSFSLLSATSVADSKKAAASDISKISADVEKKNSVKSTSEFSAENPLGVVVILPPGLALNGNPSPYLDEFSNLVADVTGVPREAIRGFFGRSEKEGAEQASAMKHALIFSDTRFFATYVHKLKLTPLMCLQETLSAQGQHRGMTSYALIAAKGRFKSLKEAKGREIVGVSIGQIPFFWNGTLLAGTGMTASDFQWRNTTRPLREIRKLKSGGLDLVILKSSSLSVLEKLPEFPDLEVIHRSVEFPNIGVMGRGLAAKGTLAEKIQGALTGLCDRQDAKPLCIGFGIQRFIPVDQHQVSIFIKSLKNKADL